MASRIVSRFAIRVASVLVLARLITPDFRLDASSISITEVPLREVIAGANIIIVAKVEQIASVEYSNAKDDEPELRVFDLKVEDVLKPRGGIAAELKGTTIRAFDPRDKYQHDHYEQIQAGVVSFVEKRYATKVGTVAEGDHLIFFLNEHRPAEDFPLPHAYVLAVGQAYDLVGDKAAVLHLVK